MIASLRFFLSLAALIAFATSSLVHAQISMMLRNNSSPFSGFAINRGDFNNDGILDLITISNSNSQQINVFLGRADGTFAPPISTTTVLPLGDIAIADFNGDGKLDVAVTNIVGNSIEILLGRGDGTFTDDVQLFTQQPAISITTSDFNNDGKMDLAIGESGSSNVIEILKGNGDGTFNVGPTMVPMDSSSIKKVRVGDFNGDGKVDIAVLQNNEGSALFGNGDFTFQQIPLVSGGFNDMNTVDINQDGFTDILISDFDGGTTGDEPTGSVLGFFGTSGHSFNFQTVIESGNRVGDFGSPSEMIAADVNGDGINDIVALDDNAASANGVYVWLGNADGSFQQTPVEFIYTTDRDKTALVAGDFNRDGKIDFAATLVGNSTVEVLLNATPRSACQKNTANPSMTVCQPQEATFSNSPLHIVAEGNDSKGVSDIDVFIDNVKKDSFASSSINQFFSLPNGNHFVVVKGFDATGASFRSDRHVTMFSGAPGETCPSSSSTVLSVNICLPAQNGTMSSPVQIFANSYSPRPITAIQVYIDNQLVFNDQTATEVNKLFSMTSGSHFIVVKAFDATGNNVSESRTVDVK